MFESRKDLQAKLTAQEAEITRLETELAASQELINEAAGKDQRLAELTEDLEAAKAALVSEAEAHESTKVFLAEEEAKTTPEAITKLVTAQLATAGHPPIEDAPEKDEQETRNYHAEYEELSRKDSRAAAQFWEENKAEIVKTFKR